MNLLSHLTRLRGPWHRSLRDDRQQMLGEILGAAHHIARTNPPALRDLVRLLGRKLQSDYLTRAWIRMGDDRVPDLAPEIAWFSSTADLGSGGTCLDTLKRRLSETRQLNLACDLVMPSPWAKNRMATCLSTIGPGKPLDAWRQDHNHQIEYWLPWGIGWVSGGNHSLASGIVQADGFVEPTDIYDVSAVFKHVEFDGHNFIRTTDRKALQYAEEFEFAAIFEVGRLMRDYGVSA